MAFTHTTTFTLRVVEGDVVGIPFLTAQLIDHESGRVLDSCGISAGAPESLYTIRRLAEDMTYLRHGIDARGFAVLWAERDKAPPSEVSGFGTSPDEYVKER